MALHLATIELRFLLRNKDVFSWRASLVPTFLHYTSLSLANEITICNAIPLLLLRLGSQIIGSCFDPSIPSLNLPKALNYNPLYPAGSAPNAQAVAIEICRSIEYHLLDAACSAGAFFLLFPISLAYRTFDPTSREARWLTIIMKSIATPVDLRLVGIFPHTMLYQAVHDIKGLANIIISKV